MRFEIVLILVACFLVANIYTEGKYVKKLYAFKKYYQIGGVLLGALFLYWFMKKNPASARDMIYNTHEYVKYLPVDRNVSANFIEPLINFTKEKYTDDGYSQPILSFDKEKKRVSIPQAGLIDTTKHKRSVSDAKKKYVAARQKWRCASCDNLLSASYEIDHKIRVANGGNDLSNLQALCRNCHGEKTLTEVF